MTVIILKAIIVLLGISIFALCAAGIYSPSRLINLVRSTWARVWALYVAIGVRLLLGIALVVIAADSRFPVIFEILGWITILASIGIIFVGRERIGRIIDKFGNIPATITRLWLIGGLLFASFLIYGVV